MRKSTRLLKRYLATFLIVLMSIESFAAVVGDNDGAAFITKAEFDSMKNDFQSQLDRYNSSIDNKIDGAIASYLAGINLARKIELEPLVNNVEKIRWMHGPYVFYKSRKWQGYGESATYIDEQKWRILDTENRRGIGRDGYFWFADYLWSEYATMSIHGLLCPTDYPDNFGSQDPRYRKSRGPSIYVEAVKTADGKWVVSADNGIKAETCLAVDIHLFAHKEVDIPDDVLTGTAAVDGFNGVVKWTDINAEAPLASGPSTYDNFTVRTADTYLEKRFWNLIWSLPVGNATIDGHQEDIWDAPKLSDVPQALSSEFIVPVLSNMALKEGNIDETYGSIAARTSSGLYTDVRWSTLPQFTIDNANIIYGMWGANVDGSVNIAPPPIQQNDMSYLDLSESASHAIVPCAMKLCSAVAGRPRDFRRDTVASKRWHAAQGPDTSGFISVNIPLFYRQSWNDLYSGEIILKSGNQPLKKSQGIPILLNASESGNVQLSIDYEEKGDTDTSLTTLTPDQKIKTYFKTRAFDDNTGKFLNVFLNLDGSGTPTSLNGTEWTSNKITINAEVEKGDDVWMKIDPLTENGVYCKITNMTAYYITE